MKNKLCGLVLKNLEIYKSAKEVGFDYLVNPDTDELHKTDSSFLGSHNLTIANLENFIGLTNLGTCEIHKFADGTLIPVYDLFTGKIIGTYKLNKCSYCFPQQNK